MLFIPKAEFWHIIGSYKMTTVTIISNAKARTIKKEEVPVLGSPNRRISLADGITINRCLLLMTSFE